MNAPALRYDDVTRQFAGAMAEAGLRIADEIHGDGEIHRFHVDGDAKNTRNGWYVLFLDGTPAGEFGSWKTGLQVTWCADSERLTPQQRDAANARIEAARKEREQRERERQASAAQRAQALWDGAADADDAHPYLARKGVPSHGLRVADWPLTDVNGRTFKTVPNTLLVPIKNRRGDIISLQGIFPAKQPDIGRDKDFWRDGRKRGGYYRIGQFDGTSTVAICEGYATGATIHAATGWSVVVAFDAYNLQSVAEKVREFVPQALIVICADNDRWTIEPVENPGVTKAKAAGASVNARVIVPDFADLDGQPTDFNDLAAREGIAEVQRQLAVAQPSVPAHANDNMPVAFDAHTPLPHVGGGGRPKATIENVAEILRRMRASVRYNVIGKRNEFTIPGESFAIDNAENDALARVESRCAEAGMATGSLPRIVSYLAGQNQYNPAATWILSRPWDGVSRLQDFYATVTPQEVKTLPDGRQLHQVLMLRWMLSAVAAAFEPNGVSAHGVLVLQGEQYLGKTKWFRSLVPDDLSLTKEGMILRPDDKDSVKQACSFWLVELGELDATFRKSDISALKSFITNRSDVLRMPYARGESHFARRTVFFGSVNPREYLHDTTGNRRYWTIECRAIHHSHQLDMQQVFAEVHALYQAGERHYLTPDEHAAMNASNEAFQVADTIEERLQAKLDWTAPQAEWTWRTATEILMQTGIDKPNRDEASKAGAALRKLNGGQGRRTNGKTLLLAPPLPGRNTGNWERPF
ncbi:MULTISPECIES: VapE domain-containing protein [Burkholderia]|uniref:VapE domain-containing protein n=1 Tax=Burkholderia TaxID=32008 RepID=UPI0008415D2C|nr:MULTISPECIES: VapE domain-containing protein [unclassified Burkholderia]AOK29868.1 hypothetical protein AQ611_10970 [Burkholderia sp. Bp7605]